jgi:hypothetical protein
MNFDANIGTEKILLAKILWRCDSILEALGATSSGSEATDVGGTIQEEKIVIGDSSDGALHVGISSDTLSGTGDSPTTQEGIVVDFLRFDDTSNPLRWIHRCECYFSSRRTPENKRVTYATLHLIDDAQL